MLCTNPEYYNCTCSKQSDDKIICESLILICDFKKEDNDD